MICVWFFPDDDVFSIEKLRKVVQKLPRINEGRLSHGMQIPISTLLKPLGRAACALWALNFILAQWHRRSALVCLGAPIGVALALVCVDVLLKTPPRRVVWPLLFLSIVPPLMFMAKPVAVGRRKVIRRGLLCVVAAALIVQLPSIVSQTSARSIAAKKQHLVLKQVLGKLKPRPDQLYVIWSASLPWESIHPFESLAYLRSFRTFSLGVAQRTPDTAKVLSEFGIDNLLLELGSRDDLFLILWRHPEPKMAYAIYMKEHYGLGVKARTKYFPKFTINKMSYRTLPSKEESGTDPNEP